MRCSFITACVVALLLAPLAGAQTYEIKLKHSPDIGKSVTVKDASKKTENSKITIGDKNQDKKGTDSDDEDYAEKVLAKKDTEVTKYEREYKKATRTVNGKAEARSYEGRTVVFEKTDGKFVVSVEGKELAPADMKELTKKANEHDDDMDKVFLPAKAVKVGETWKLDGKALGKAFGKNDEFDPETTKGDAKLTKAYKKGDTQMGVIEVTLKLGLKLPPEFKTESPAVIEMKITLDAAIDGSSTAGAMTMTGKMTMKGSTEQMGVKVVIDTNLEMTGKQERTAEK